MPDQIWGDDTFLEGSPVYGVTPVAYVNLKPWNTSPETTTGYSLRVAHGDLSDELQQRELVTEGFAAFARFGGNGDDACWAVERRQSLDECQISFAPSIYTFSGTPDGTTFRQFGLCACVQGGTQVTGGSDADDYYRDVSGYFLIETKLPTGIHRLLLLKLASGSITVLAGQDVAAVDSAHVNAGAGDFFQPRPMRLTVQLVSGNQRVTGYRTSLAGTEQQLFGGPITTSSIGAGRAGFGLQAANDVAGSAYAVGSCDVFTIKNVGATSTLFSDRFQRSYSFRWARRFGPGTQLGQSLSSCWATDSRTFTSTPLSVEQAGLLYRDTGTPNQIAAGVVPGSQSGNFALSAHPRSNINQRVALSLMRVGTGSVVELGALVRFNVTNAQVLPGSDVRSYITRSSSTRRDGRRFGYAVYVRHDAGASVVWQLEVVHYNGGPINAGVKTLLATANLASFSLAVGTAFELDVEIQNTDGTQFGQGNFVSLSIKIDSVAVTPVAENVTGVTVNGNALVDLRSEATQTAGAVGIYFDTDTPGTNQMACLSFADRALTSPPDPGPEEQATVPLDAETFGASGTLTVNESAEVSETIVTEPLRHDFESGRVQVINTQRQYRTAWSVSAVMTASEWDAALALFETNGSAVPFNWTHPYTGAQYVVALQEDSLAFDQLQAIGESVVYEARFNLLQLFDTTVLNPSA